MLVYSADEFIHLRAITKFVQTIRFKEILFLQSYYIKLLHWKIKKKIFILNQCDAEKS